MWESKRVLVEFHRCLSAQNTAYCILTMNGIPYPNGTDGVMLFNAGQAGVQYLTNRGMNIGETMRKYVALFSIMVAIVATGVTNVSVRIQAEHPFSFTDESIAISCYLRNNGTNVIPVLSFPPDNRRGQMFFSDPSALSAHTKVRMSKEYSMIRTHVDEAGDILKGPRQENIGRKVVFQVILSS